MPNERPAKAIDASGAVLTGVVLTVLEGSAMLGAAGVALGPGDGVVATGVDASAADSVWRDDSAVIRAGSPMLANAFCAMAPGSPSIRSRFLTAAVPKATSPKTPTTSAKT
jgi:hypothetical protein